MSFPEDAFRTDTTYTLQMSTPYGVGVAGALEVIASDGTVVLESKSFKGPPVSQPADGEYCELLNKEPNDLIAKGDPSTRKITLVSGLDLAEMNLNDKATLSATVTVNATDDLGVMQVNPIARPALAPQVFLDSEGLSTLSAWGVVLTVIGGIVVLPPVCAIMVAFGSD